MFKKLTTFVSALALLLGSTTPCAARGGGGFHGGGGGFHGGGFGGGGFHGGGYGGGGFGGGGYRGGFGGGGYGGGFHGGDFGGYRGGDLGGFRGGDLGDRGFAGDRDLGGRGMQDFDRGAGRDLGGRGFADHANLPSDHGFGHAGARSYLATGHATHAWSHNTMRDRGNVVRNNFWNHNTFNRNWWHDHPGAWFAAGWGLGTAWAWTAWPALGGWYGWGDDVAPIYYDYGTNVTYDNDEVYYGDQPYGTADEFYDQAESIANNAQSTDPQQGEWKPLGVFGLVQGEQTTATAMFQLATSKDGTIAGNFCDLLSGNTLQVKGSVDQKTQRAAWTVGDNTSTVYEAGIYNLTQEQAPVLVHFGKDRTQQWLLVRMKQPDQAQQADSDTPPAPDTTKQ